MILFLIIRKKIERENETYCLVSYIYTFLRKNNLNIYVYTYKKSQNIYAVYSTICLQKEVNKYYTDSLVDSRQLYFTKTLKLATLQNRIALFKME